MLSGIVEGGSTLHRLGMLYDPARFQGAYRRDGYFEGWYFKFVGRRGEADTLAVIPGVSRAAGGDEGHAFVQVIRPGGRVRYFAFPLWDFRYARDRFAISVGPNVFDRHHISLDLEGDDAGPPIRGEVRSGSWWPWPVTLTAPGIMGWYRYVPSMECYHGVLSMDHAVSGTLLIDGAELVLDGGRGYVEKDWGVSFPSSWIWAQSNHFGTAGVSCTVSVARIPWRGSSFTGHIAGLLLDGRLHRFATYTGSRLLEVASAEGHARIVMGSRRMRLEIDLEGAVPGALKAPVLGAMQGRSDEALDGRLRVRLVRDGSGVVFAAEGRAAGVEVMDRRGELRPDPPT